MQEAYNMSIIKWIALTLATHYNGKKYYIVLSYTIFYTLHFPFVYHQEVNSLEKMFDVTKGVDQKNFN